MPSDDDIALVDRRRLRWDPTDPSTLLGEGSFGIVYSGRFNGTPVAIKVVKRPPPAEDATEEDKLREHAALKQHRREIHRFKVVLNPYIIQYLGVFRGEHPRDLYIVTEFLEGGSLHDSLSKLRARKASLDERSFLQIAVHIARGLNHVHESSYTHGDMKPQNILLTSAFQFVETEGGSVSATIPDSAKAKIADFGLSKRLDGAESAGIFGSTTATTDFGTGPCGTYLYMSPEAYEGISRLSDSEAKAADVYAFALVLFELLSGLQSWGLERVRNPMQLSAFVRSGKRPAWGSRESSIDPAYIDLVKRCWSQKPEDRPTMEDTARFLEEQEQLLERRKMEMVKCPSSQAFSDVTKQEACSPECMDENVDHKMPHHVTKPESSDILDDANGRGFGTDEDTDSRTAGSPSELCEGEECERIDTLVHSEDDAHTLEDGEDIFPSHELDGIGPPSITPVRSMRLTATEVEMYRPKQTTQDDTRFALRDSEGSSYDSGSETSKEDVEDSDEDLEGAVPNAVSDLPIMNGTTGLDSQENAENRFVDSIAGPHKVQQVDSFMIPVPDVQPLDLPNHDRPVWGTGSTAANNGNQGGGLRSDTALLKSFVGVPLADDGNGHPSTKAVQRADDGAQGEVDEKAGEDPNSFFEAFGKIDLGPKEAPPLPPAPTESAEPDENGEHNFASTGHPKTPDETEAAKAVAQQTKANIYMSPNVAEEEFNTYSEIIDTPGSGFASRPGESWPADEWSRFQGLPQNRPHRPAEPMNVVPVSAPTSQGFVPELSHHNNYANSYSHQPSPYISFTDQGASAPPLSDTSQSAMCAAVPQVPHQMPNRSTSPAWASPGSNFNPIDPNHRIPLAKLNPSLHAVGHAVDDSMVVTVLQRRNAAAVLREWWNHGFMQPVASGLARAHDIGGEELLELVREFIARNNQTVQEHRNPKIAKDLCAAIGHIARNSSIPLGPQAVTRAVRDVLSVLPAFNFLVSKRNEVFSFTNFALCNLFKVYNVIQEYELRTSIASWISYSIDWNVSPGEGAPRDEVLAYTATSAARNFMWMNEENVRAFVGCNNDNAYRAPPPPVTLISSMKYFDWTGSLSVVESSLSAMATVIHFPRQRAEFMKAHGSDAVMDVLSKHAANSDITSLSFWMVTVLFSGPPTNHSHQEAETLRKAFIDHQGCQKFVKALGLVGQFAPSEKQKVESLEKGYNALLTVARFGGSLRAHLIEAGCMPMILNAVRQLASSPYAQYPNKDDALMKARRGLGVVLCELIREVSNEHKGMSYMRDNNVRHPLENMMQIHRADEGLTNSCRVALTKLAY